MSIDESKASISIRLTYDNFIKNLKTGDILLYKSNYWYSRLIEYFTGSNFSHISIILKNPIWLNNKLTEEYYILESGYEKIPDSISDKNIYGINIIPLRQVFNDYTTNSGYLYIRRIETNIPEYDINNSIIKTYNYVKDKPYDIYPLDWIESYLNINKSIDKIYPQKQRTDVFWCSSLITFIYMECDFLKKDIPFTLITPKDWSWYSNRLQFINCKLTKEEWII